MFKFEKIIVDWATDILGYTMEEIEKSFSSVRGFNNKWKFIPYKEVDEYVWKDARSVIYDLGSNYGFVMKIKPSGGACTITSIEFTVNNPELMEFYSEVKETKKLEDVSEDQKRRLLELAGGIAVEKEESEEDIWKKKRRLKQLTGALEAPVKPVVQVSAKKRRRKVFPSTTTTKTTTTKTQTSRTKPTAATGTKDDMVRRGMNAFTGNHLKELVRKLGLSITAKSKRGILEGLFDEGYDYQQVRDAMKDQGVW